MSGRIPGPRGGTRTREGAFQFPALSAETAVRVPGEWIGELCRLSWAPETAGALLFYTFVIDPDPSSDSPTVDSIAELTASTAGGDVDFGKVAMAPDFIAGAGSDDIEPPLEYRSAGCILILKPASAGRVVFRHAER